MKTSLSLVLALLLFNAAAAATFTVTRTDDPVPGTCAPSDCSLREAVNAANAAPGTDTVQLRSAVYSLTRTDATPDTYQADLGPLWVRTPMIVDGAGMDATTIRWNGNAHFFNEVFVTDAQTAAPVALRLRELTLSNGRGATGGCVRMEQSGSAKSRLTIDHARIEQCTASRGGAVYLSHAQLSLDAAQLRNNSADTGGALELAKRVDVDSQASELRDNHATLDGGAVRVDGVASSVGDIVWVDDGRSVIADNSAGRDGGAFAIGREAVLDLSTSADAPAGQLLALSGNTAAGSGGALALLSKGNSIEARRNRIDRVRMSGNTAALNGGALVSSFALAVAGSQIDGNRANGGAGGGGIAMLGSVAASAGRTIDSSVLRGNSTNGAGGAIYSECSTFDATNVALLSNTAAPNRGSALDTLGTANLRHVTAFGNVGPGAWKGIVKSYSTACPSTRINIGNSLVTDICASTVAGTILSSGGNQMLGSEYGCPAGPGDARQSVQADFHLQFFDTFGGDFQVPGWYDDGSSHPQQDSGSLQGCVATDIRGAARSDGRCDAGAFEWTRP